MVNINVSSENLNYESASGILYDKGLVTLVQCPAGKVGAVSIEGTVTRIASYAFSACAGITSIGLPSGLNRIDYSAFSHCTSLTAIVLPSNLTELGNYAFSYCSALTTISIPDNVTYLNKSTFNMCTSLNRIEVGPGNVAYASSDGMLYDKNKTKLIICPTGLVGSPTISPTTVSIEPRAFYQCTGITEVIVPASVTSIGEQAFYRCTSLANFTILGGVTSIRIMSSTMFQPLFHLIALHREPHR